MSERGFGLPAIVLCGIVPCVATLVLQFFMAALSESMATFKDYHTSKK